jgi:hypothetical protein
MGIHFVLKRECSPCVGSRQSFHREAAFVRAIRCFLVCSAKQDDRAGFVDAPPAGRIHSSLAKKRPCKLSAGDHAGGQNRYWAS